MKKKEKVIQLEQQVHDQQDYYGFEEDIVLEELSELSNRELYDLIKTIDRMSSNLRYLKKDLSNKLKGNVHKSAQRFDDDIVIGRPKFTWKPYDKNRVIDYLGDDWKEVVNPTFRITGIQAIARKRGQDPWVILESLFEQVEQPGIDIRPVNKAPKYLNDLDEGEIVQIDKGE